IVRFHAQSAGGDTASAPSTIRVVTRYPVVAPLEGNRLHAIVSNLGAIADLRPGAGNVPSFTHVNGSALPAATSAGIMLGALVGGDLRMAVGGGDGEFVPGPMNNGEPSAPDPRFKNYRIRAGHPEDFDWVEWPTGQGAPEDAFGSPGLQGREMVWSVYNDADALAHTDQAGGTAPLGVEVRQSSFARLSPGVEEDAVHLRYRLTNQSPQAWTGAYFSFAFFPQFWEAAGHVGVQFNEFAGCDTTLEMAYAYSREERLVSDGGPPGAVGVMLIEGPKVAGVGVTDTLGMSSCRMPRCGPASAAESYDVLQGLSAGGIPLHEYGDPGRPVTRFEYTGDPVRGEGWLDPSPVSCSSEQIFLNTGPFTLPAGESQELEYVVLYARGADRLGSVFALRQAARELRGYFPGPNTMPAYIEPPDVVPGVEAESLAIDLQGFDMDGDELYITASPLPEGATIRMISKQTALFAWRPPYGSEGSYPLQVVVTDGRSASYEAPMLITVAHGNYPPVADGGSGYCSFAGEIMFDGSASYDPEGDPLTFHWEFGDGEAADGMTVLHYYAEIRDYAASLTVSDPSHSSTADVIVSACVPSAADGIEATPAGILRLDSRNSHYRLRVTFTGDGGPGFEPDLTGFRLHRVAPAPPRDRAETVLSADVQASTWTTPESATGELELAFGLDGLRSMLADLPAGVTEARLRLAGRRVSGAAFELELVLSVDAGRRPLELGVAPNPFNPVGTISFRTTRPGSARITVHDPSGRRVATLLDESWLPAGYHDVMLDTRSSRSQSLPSGVYFLKISAAEGESRGRFVILK
ncbi:MAG: PKD domain-containing protein, partial [Candidatus Eisenbacteria bacterium]